MNYLSHLDHIPFNVFSLDDDAAERDFVWLKAKSFSPAGKTSGGLKCHGAFTLSAGSDNESSAATAQPAVVEQTFFGFDCAVGIIKYRCSTQLVAFVLGTIIARISFFLCPGFRFIGIDACAFTKFCFTALVFIFHVV